MAYSYRVEGGGTPSYRLTNLMKNLKQFNSSIQIANNSTTIKNADGSTTTQLNDAQHTVVHQDKNGNIRTTFNTKNGNVVHTYNSQTGEMTDSVFVQGKLADVKKYKE